MNRLWKAMYITFEEEIGFLMMFALFIIIPVGGTYLVTRTTTGLLIFGTFVLLLMVVVFIGFIIGIVKWFIRKTKELIKNYSEVK